jgi:hypothetical protein
VGNFMIRRREETPRRTSSTDGAINIILLNQSDRSHYLKLALRALRLFESSKKTTRSRFVFNFFFADSCCPFRSSPTWSTL